jgi:hypothetical protein
MIEGGLLGLPEGAALYQYTRVRSGWPTLPQVDTAAGHTKAYKPNAGGGTAANQKMVRPTV